jgi:hypothetical protein
MRESQGVPGAPDTNGPCYILNGISLGNRERGGEPVTQIPRWVHEWTRATAFCPSTTGSHADVIVVLDRIRKDTAPPLGPCTGPDTSACVSGAALASKNSHSALEGYLTLGCTPSVSGKVATCTTSNGQAIRAEWYLPTTSTLTTGASVPGTNRIKWLPGTSTKPIIALYTVSVGGSNPVSVNTGTDTVTITRSGEATVTCTYDDSAGQDIPASQTNGSGGLVSQDGLYLTYGRPNALVCN